MRNTQSLQVQALPFMVQRIKNKAGFSRSANPCHDNELVLWNFRCNIFEIMQSGIVDFDLFHFLRPFSWFEPDYIPQLFYHLNCRDSFS
ncbi:hypothetical protein D3C78_881500 [compost metagenome]